MLINHRVFWL